MGYSIKKAFKMYPELSAYVNGRTVGLNGGYKKEIPAFGEKPAKPVEIPAATQADLEALFKEGNPCIENDGGETKRQPLPENDEDLTKDLPDDLQETAKEMLKSIKKK